MSTLTELGLRQALRAYLVAGAPDPGHIVEEFGIEGGSARIDVALITDRLIGFEIKSDLDSFDRLSNQVHAYNRVFDQITLVTGRTLLEDATRLLPSWWGIISAHYTVEGLIELSPVRKATKNPTQCALSVAALLWKAEATEALASHTHQTIPSRWTSSKLYEKLAEVLPLESLQPLVAAKLMARSSWRSVAPLRPDGDLSHLVAMSKGTPTWT